MSKAIKPITIKQPTHAAIQKQRAKARSIGDSCVCLCADNDGSSLESYDLTCMTGLSMNLFANIADVRPGGRVEAIVDGVLDRMTMLNTSSVKHTEEQTAFLSLVVAARRDYPKDFLEGVLVCTRDILDSSELDHY